MNGCALNSRNSESCEAGTELVNFALGHFKDSKTCPKQLVELGLVEVDRVSISSHSTGSILSTLQSNSTKTSAVELPTIAASKKKDDNSPLLVIFVVLVVFCALLFAVLLYIRRKKRRRAAWLTAAIANNEKSSNT